MIRIFPFFNCTTKFARISTANGIRIPELSTNIPDLAGVIVVDRIEAVT